MGKCYKNIKINEYTAIEVDLEKVIYIENLDAIVVLNHSASLIFEYILNEKDNAAISDDMIASMLKEKYCIDDMTYNDLIADIDYIMDMFCNIRLMQMDIT